MALITETEAAFTLLPDHEDLYMEWKRIVSQYRVSGKPTHDARLVAAMTLHGVRSFLTFNVRDFTRYAGLSVRHPRDL